jgi:DNA-binding transcriptional MerR regulator/methylmalonyl-CoA mutase cobalamin-binding subunit
MPAPHHSIKTVARLTGLSPHLIRMWEKRYNAVSPQRTSTNRRLYSEAEIEKLNLLRQATTAGHSIGNIARLSRERLMALVAKADLNAVGASLAGGRPSSPAQAFHDSCIAAAERFDAQLFNETLQKAVVALGHQGLLRQVVGPLAETVGELWRQGGITAAHEHFLTASLKIFLGHLSGQFSAAANAPRLVIATPAGQLHELGAVIVRDAAAQIGWRTIYLGANLPAAEIAGAAVQNRAAAVALSIVYPEDDPDLPQELTNLRRFLPNETRILAGGRAASAYSETLSRIGALVMDDIDQFSNQLDALRHAGPQEIG